MSDATPSYRTNKRAVFYFRVSTADQRSQRQELDLLAYADRAGLEVMGVFKNPFLGLKPAVLIDRNERRCWTWPHVSPIIFRSSETSALISE